MSVDALTKPAVTQLLQARMDPGLECARLERGPVGNAQETWFVEAVDAAGRERRLVLRRSAASGTLEHTDRGREFALLEALAVEGFPVPRVHWLETQPSALGRPYFVMDRLAGVPPARLSAAAGETVARALGAWLARLHAVPAGALPGVPSPAPTAAEATREQLREWRDRYLAARRAPVPAIGALLGWLEAHVPEREVPARVLWGDPGPHNLLVAGEAITGLLDWELAHAGDPLEDLGAALWAAPTSGLDREHVVAGYEDLAGPVDRDALRYFEVMACVDRSIMLVGGVAAYLDGGARPSTAALGQQLLLASLQRATALAGWGAAPAAGPPPRREGPAARLRPDASETAAAVARFLRADVLPAISDPGLRREVKTAAALLETAARRAALEEAGVADVEDEAGAAERGRTADRAALRARLVEDLAAQRALILPLDELFSPARR